MDIDVRFSDFPVKKRRFDAFDAFKGLIYKTPSLKVMIDFHKGGFLQYMLYMYGFAFDSWIAHARG